MRHQSAAALSLLLRALLLGALALTACGNNDQPNLEAFCQRLEIAFGPEGALAADYSDDPSGAEAVVDELEAVRQVSPLEIEPSLATITETASLIIAISSSTEATGSNNTGLNAEQLEESAAASAELARYSAEHCGLKLDWESPAVFFDPDKIPGEVSLDILG